MQPQVWLARTSGYGVLPMVPNFSDIDQDDKWGWRYITLGSSDGTLYKRSITEATNH